MPSTIDALENIGVNSWTKILTCQYYPTRHNTFNESTEHVPIIVSVIGTK